MAGSGLRPVSKILHCCLPKKFGLCLSPNVAGHSLKPAKDHWLGALLSHQLPNPAQAHHTATVSLSADVPQLYGRFLRVPHQFATPPLAAFDLHVLNLPQAFILGQDHTHCIKSSIDTAGPCTAFGLLTVHCGMHHASDELMYACGHTQACTVKLENKAVCFDTSDWYTQARPIHRQACVPERFFKTVEHSSFCLKLFVYQVDAPQYLFGVHKRTQLRVLAQCVCMLEPVSLRSTYIRSCVHSFVFFKS